jgi:hypothetical protein
MTVAAAEARLACDHHRDLPHRQTVNLQNINLMKG